jgi:hypothetical protein
MGIRTTIANFSLAKGSSSSHQSNNQSCLYEHSFLSLCSIITIASLIVLVVTLNDVRMHT